MASNQECASEDMCNGLHLNPDLADVNFIFESHSNHIERVPAHKILLTTASDVFRVMFNGDWKEDNKVKITDASAGVFKEFLQFFYTDRVKLTVANVNEVFKLCHKYNVTKCMDVCKKFMVNTLTNDTILQRYALAIQFDQDDLMNALEKIIEVDTKGILGSTEFLKCSRNVLCGILNMEFLSCTEVELFEACMNWVKAAANQSQLTRNLVKSRLGNLFRYIRFGSMSIKEFAAITESYREIFSLHEYTDIIQMIENKEHKSKFFNGIRTKRTLKDCGITAIAERIEARVICDRSVYSPAKDQRIGTKDTTTFSTTHPLLLRTVHLPMVVCRPSNEITYLPIEVVIEEIPNSAISTDRVLLYKCQTTLPGAYACKKLGKPILIKPGFKYQIHLQHSSRGHFYINQLLKDKVEMQSGITIDFYPDAKDVYSPGLIWMLGFDTVWPLQP